MYLKPEIVCLFFKLSTSGFSRSENVVGDGVTANTTEYLS